MMLSTLLFLIFVFFLFAIGYLNRSKNDSKIHINYIVDGEKYESDVPVNKLSGWLLSHKKGNIINQDLPEIVDTIIKYQNQHDSPVDKLDIENLSAADFSLFTAYGSGKKSRHKMLAIENQLSDALKKNSRKKYVLNKNIGKLKDNINKDFNKKYEKKHIGRDNLDISQKSKLLETDKYKNLSRKELSKKAKEVKELAKQELHKNKDINYENLQKLIEAQEFLTADEEEKLYDNIEKGAKSIDYDNMKDESKKYKFLEKHAKSLGFQDVYDKAKKTAVKTEISEHKDKISSKDIIPAKKEGAFYEEIDNIPFDRMHKKLSEIEKVAENSGALDDVVDIYIKKFKEELGTYDIEKKFDLVSSILQYDPEDSVKKQIASKVKEYIIESESKAIENAIVDINQKSEHINIFDSEDKLKKVRYLVGEARLIKDKNKDYIPADAYNLLEEQDSMLIEHFANKFITDNLRVYFEGDGSLNNELFLEAVFSKGEDNTLPLFDVYTSDAFFEFFCNMPTISEFSKIKGIKDGLGITDDALNGQDMHHFGKAISEVITYRAVVKKNELIKTQRNGQEPLEMPELSSIAKNIMNITNWSLELSTASFSNNPSLTVKENINNFLLEKIFNSSFTKDSLENFKMIPWLNSDFCDNEIKRYVTKLDETFNPKDEAK